MFTNAIFLYCHNNNNNDDAVYTNLGWGENRNMQYLLNGSNFDNQNGNNNNNGADLSNSGFPVWLGVLIGIVGLLVVLFLLFIIYCKKSSRKRFSSY